MRVVTPPFRLGSGSWKQQIPAHRALPRSFVSPRHGIRHPLGVGSEKHGGVPAFGTRVWAGVTAKHFALLFCFLRRGATHHAAIQPSHNVHSTSMEADSANLDVFLPDAYVKRSISRIRIDKSRQADGIVTLTNVQPTDPEDMALESRCGPVRLGMSIEGSTSSMTMPSRGVVR